jgi:dolichol-phosphate mannosyltransferase
MLTTYPISTPGLVIIPTYNERENIPLLLPRILNYPQLSVLVVDDGSPDGTADIVATIAEQNARVHLLRRASKQGLGTAYIAGFRHALEQAVDYIFEMDADFSHDPCYLLDLLHAAQSTYDLVIGSRYIPGGRTIDWGFGRQLISRSGNIYAQLLLGMSIADLTSGYRCYRRRAVEAVNLEHVRSNGYSFQIEMAYRVQQAGLRIGEVPIIFPDRRVGASKMSKQIVAEALLNVIRLRLGLM